MGLAAHPHAHNGMGGVVRSIKPRLDTQVTELDMEVMDDGEAVRVGSYLVSSIVQSSQT